MPNVYTLANQYRRALLLRDEASRARLVESYQLVRAVLTQLLSQLTAQIETAQREGQAVSRLWLFRQERYQTLIQQIESEINRWAMLTVAPSVTFEQQQAINLGTQHAGSLINIQTGDLSTAFNRLPVAAFEQLAGFTADGAPLSKLLSRYGEVAAQLTKNALGNALAQGQGIQQIASQLERILDQPRWHAERLARTELLRAYREASRATYKAHGIKQWQWLAAKSKRTCAACLYLDGQIFSVEKPQPAHPNCRCTIIPVVEGFDLPARTYGAEWFTNQSAETQASVLGVSGAEAYRDGRATLGNFVGVRRSRQWGESRYQVGFPQ